MKLDRKILDKHYEEFVDLLIKFGDEYTITFEVIKGYVSFNIKKEI